MTPSNPGDIRATRSARTRRRSAERSTADELEELFRKPLKMLEQSRVRLAGGVVPKNVAGSVVSTAEFQTARDSVSLRQRLANFFKRVGWFG
jgi:hypothetical protein